MNEREQRYRQKINFIIEKVQSLPKAIKSPLEIDASLYRMQVAIEAMMDLVAMLVKDKGRTVGDDYHNLEQLVTLKVITTSFGEELKRLNGMRNAIVHKYNKFEEDTVIKSKEKIKKNVLKFVQTTEHELKTIFKSNPGRS